MRLQAICQSKGHKKRCPTCGGGVRRREYGEMYAGAFLQDGERVEIRQIPDARYLDPIVLDGLTQYFDGGLYRIWPKERYYTRGGRKLHRDAWISAFGPVPEKCHIHHIDSNPGNNLLINLECLPAKEHMWLTYAKRDPATKVFSKRARDRAAEWHRSEVGRLWHRRHAARQATWTVWKREPRPCLYCEREFDCLVRRSNPQLYCSNECKALHYHQKRKALARKGGRLVSDGS